MVKKKAQLVVGMTKDENKLLVQKSHPLTALWQSDLTLAEFKILDAYLARINSKKPEQRTVKLTKGELEEALGVTRINKADLKQRLKNLYSPIDLEPNNPKKIKLRALFEEAEAEQDEDGIWQVQLTCTPSAMKYMFNVEELGYLRYKLRCITSLTSRYSYILFLYLEFNRFRATWEVDLNSLKRTLCATDESYSEFKIFNNRVLKKCQKELSEKTECRFTYEPIRKGRSVASIRFTLEMLSPKLETEIQNRDPDQTSIFDYEDQTDENIEARERRGEICCGFEDPLFDEFSDEELTEFRSLAWSQADPDVEERHYSILHDRRVAREYAVSEYIRLKIQAMNVYAKRDPIKDRYSYLKKALGGK